MAYLCEYELRSYYGEITPLLGKAGYAAEPVLFRDYLMKLNLTENGSAIGKLIVDYSPKKNKYSIRKDSELSDAHFQRLNAVLGQNASASSKENFNANEASEKKSGGGNAGSGNTKGFSAYVDGSYLDGSVGYGAVILEDGNIVEELCGPISDPDAVKSRQVGGELKAVTEVLSWCMEKGIPHIAIYFDFLNIEKWATGAYKTNTPMTIDYKRFIDSCPVKIEWHKVASHTGIPLNDLADELAKKGALGSSKTASIKDENKEQASAGEAALKAEKILLGWLIYNGALISRKYMEQVEWLVRSARFLGMELVPIPNQELSAGIDREGTVLFEDQERGLPNYVLFWDKDIPLARCLERRGIRLFNRARTIFSCDDKILTHQLLSDNGIAMPRTLFAPLNYPGTEMDSKSFLDRVEKALGYPLVVKEAFGSFGAQVYLASDRKALEELNHRLTHVPHLYQEYVKTSHGRDVRIQIVGGKVAASMLRTSETDFRANISNGGRMQQYNPPDSFKAMALKAAALLGADFAGVDLLFGEGEAPLLCEVNSNAHMKNLFDCTGVDVSYLIMSHIKAALT